MILSISNEKAIRKPLWWQEKGLTKTKSGFGTKIETEWVIHYSGKLRRIYCDVYSNSGVCYVLVSKKKVYVG